MANYLLLRNNLQEGPFQLQQLLEKGLKPYDLVWVENKSAAWRYPTELEELKQFCNWEEEQPFDRFYKKTETSQFASSIKNNNPSNERITKFENNFSHNLTNPLSSKHISVILPITKKNSAIDHTRVALPVVQPPVVNKHTEKSDSHQIVQIFPERLNEQLEQALAQPPAIKPMNKIVGIPVKMMAGMLLLLGAGIFIGVSFNKMAITTFSRSKTGNERNELTTPVTNMATNNLSSTMPVSDIYSTTQEMASPAEIKEDVNEEDVPYPSKVQKKQQLKNNPLTKNTIPVTIADNANENLNTPDIKAEPVTKPVFKGSFTDLVQVTNNKYKLGAFGGVHHLQVSVNNASGYQLSSVEVEIQYLLANDRIFKTEILRFDNLNPGITVMKEAPKSNRGIKVQTIVKNIFSTEVDILQ